MCQTIISLCILSVISIGDSAKILGVFPTPSISHQVVFQVLTQELVRRGHEVVVITANPVFPKNKAPANLIEIDVHDISYNVARKFVTKEAAKQMIAREPKWITQVDDILLFLATIVEVQLKSEQVQQLIQEKKEYDVILIEAYMRSALIYSHLFKAPVIQVSSFGAMLENLEAIGAPSHPILYPIPFRHRLYNLSLWEKFLEYYDHMQLSHTLYRFACKEDEMLQKIFGPDIPSINELVNNVDMLFLNVHPIWMDNHPVPPSVVFMGGLHQKPTKELPQDLKSYLDSSKNGVIYVSFGTNVHPTMFPPERLQALTETLSELPFDILFKWNDDELPGRTENIKISKWLPQSDLLRHPKIKAFIMQGGLQSTDEAITAGVPLVCIPMFGDQWYNAEKYVKMKIGLKLDFFTFTKKQLKSSIETVIYNTSYRQNIVKLREQMNDEPQTPLERAVWWIEHVIRHKGGKHLRAPAANISWAEYYELKLVLIVLTCALTILVIVLYVIVSLLRFVRNILGVNDKVKKS